MCYTAIHRNLLDFFHVTLESAFRFTPEILLWKQFIKGDFNPEEENSEIWWFLVFCLCVFVRGILTSVENRHLLNAFWEWQTTEHLTLISSEESKSVFETERKSHYVCKNSLHENEIKEAFNIWKIQKTKNLNSKWVQIQRTTSTLSLFEHKTEKPGIMGYVLITVAVGP